MKNAKTDAGRWFRQATHDLAQAEKQLDGGEFSYAAFFAEQSAQKALKAYLISAGRRHVPIHSVGELARQAAQLDARFGPLVATGQRLDRHYLTSRYPDALPGPAIPAEAYARADAVEAVESGRAILEAVRSALL